MRILQVNSARAHGGTETHVLELTDYLRQRGHEVALAGRHGGAIKPDIALRFASGKDVTTAYQLRRFVKKRRFDVVHAHVAMDYPLVAAAALGLSRVRVVLTRHVLYPLDPHLIYRRVDAWIAVTAQIRGTLAPLRPKTVEVIPNWIDLTKFRYMPHVDLHRPVRLCLLGQVSPHKGHEDAIEALRALGDGYQLLIAGVGNESYVNALKSGARDLPVEFLGFVAPPELFKMVDILLAPSWEEPFGIVLLEAMAAGIPVVATAAGGPLDIIRPDIDGILIPPRDGSSLASAVRRIVTDDAGRRRMVEQARRRVETMFDARQVIPRIEGFYQRIAG